MQRDHAWHSARHLEDLDDAEEIGRLAGAARGRAAQFDPAEAGPDAGAVRPARGVDRCSAISPARSAARRSRASRASSRTSSGSRVFAPGVDHRRRPAAPARPALAAVRRRRACGLRRLELVADGVLQQLDRRERIGAAARHRADRPCRARRGRRARAPARAISTSPPGTRSRDELLAAFPEALLVTELIGQGVNGVTGDYSRGAAGFMVRDGAIAEPVAEITIASNLIDMFATLEPGSDLEFRRGIDAPTLLVPEMTVGGGLSSRRRTSCDSASWPLARAPRRRGAVRLMARCRDRRRNSSGRAFGRRGAIGPAPWSDADCSADGGIAACRALVRSSPTSRNAELARRRRRLPFGRDC